MRECARARLTRRSLHSHCLRPATVAAGCASRTNTYFSSGRPRPQSVILMTRFALHKFAWNCRLFVKHTIWGSLGNREREWERKKMHSGGAYFAGLFYLASSPPSHFPLRSCISYEKSPYSTPQPANYIYCIFFSWSEVRLFNYTVTWFIADRYEDKSCGGKAKKKWQLKKNSKKSS